MHSVFASNPGLQAGIQPQSNNNPQKPLQYFTMTMWGFLNTLGLGFIDYSQ